MGYEEVWKNSFIKLYLFVCLKNSMFAIGQVIRRDYGHLS